MKDIIAEDRSLINIERYLVEEVQGKELWGDLNVSLEEYEILRSKIKEALERMDIESVCNRYPVSLTTLVVFLMRYKYNLNFWGLLGEEISVKFDGNKETTVGKCTRRVFDRYGFDYSDAKEERRVNIGPILYEAGLPPESSLDDLFYVLKYDSHTIFDPLLIIDDLIDMRSYKIRKPLLKFLKRFKDKRAVDFLLDVQDAILSVDQNMTGSSCYIANYQKWKEQERDKSTVATRKKQDFQTRPYLTFENGKRGLCMVLPRSIMQDEWIENVEWTITDSHGSEIHKTVNVFGDEGQRYVESITVPVSPSSKYEVSLRDEERIDEEKLLSWTIDGIKGDGILFFNSNGRMINPNYVPFPYGIVVCGKNASIKEVRSIITTYQSYPSSQTDNNNDYSIIAIEPTGRDASMTYSVDGYERSISARPQVNIGFEGKTLFNMQPDEKFDYFTEIPSLHIDLDEGTIVKGLELRIGNERFSLEESFEDGHAHIDLKTIMRGLFAQYGTYSLRLYQGDNFIKHAKFNYVPNIKTNYSPDLEWPDKDAASNKKVLKFERSADWTLEFPGCVVKNDEQSYIVECPTNIGEIQILLNSDMDNVYFSHAIEIPVRPFEISILNASKDLNEENTGKILKLDLNEFRDQYWLSIECFGDYRNYHYVLKLMTFNGVEQTETVSLSYGGCGNIDLTCFNDTLSRCPLPAIIKLSCDELKDKNVSIMIISDNVHLHQRPAYSRNGYILVDKGDIEKDLTVKKFADSSFEMKLLHDDIRTLTSKKGTTFHGYKCEDELTAGIYIIQKLDGEILFDFEDDSEAIPTNDRDTMYVSDRKKGDPVFSFSDWLDQLIKDILATGINKDLKESESYRLLGNLSGFSEKAVTHSDLIKLISLAFFHDAKCIDNKKSDIEECMHTVSEVILNGSSRYEMIKVLAEMDCDPEIFDECMKNYNLLLFEAGGNDSIELAEKIENKSAELSLLLRMGIDDTVRDVIWREKYRELLGREAIRTMLSVPNEDDPAAIAEEQKKFLREQSPCKVKINLSNEISGDMKPIQEMISFYKNTIYLDLKKKPDFGIYMDYIRFVDQYVNWYKLSHDKHGEMHKWKKDRMISLVASDCSKLVKGMKDIKTSTELRDLFNRYEHALSYRFDDDPERDLTINRPDRFFYLQGLAAFLAKLPIEYRRQFAHVIRPAEHFMTVAMTIAPRIAQRDLIMASTYIYLVRKEEKLCR